MILSQCHPLKEILTKSGYVLDLKLEQEELNTLRNLIKEHSLELLNKYYPQNFEQLKKVDPPNYVNYAHLYDHKTVWTKKNRIFPNKHLEVIKQLPFFLKLKELFGDFIISNEEELYDEEVYWRIVRPNEKNDIGPMHADKWFWDIGYGKMPVDCFRVKIWIALWCNPGNNGLKIVPYSHHQDYDYTIEVRDKMKKPSFDESKYNLNIHQLQNQPGDCVIFNDKTLHGGCLNTGESSRISMEFTMCVSNKMSNYNLLPE